MYRIQTDGNLKASQVLKNIKDNRLDLYLNALLDIDFLYAKEIKLLGGYIIYQ